LQRAGFHSQNSSPGAILIIGHELQVCHITSSVLKFWDFDFGGFFSELAQIFNESSTELVKNMEWKNSLRFNRNPDPMMPVIAYYPPSNYASKEHRQDTYILFVELIKAFDTANHDLLFAIIAKYGAPSTLIDVIKCLPERGLQTLTCF
jgi:hypothetical protein